MLRLLAVSTLASALAACSHPSHPMPASPDAASDGGVAVDASPDGPQVEIMYRTRSGIAVLAAANDPVPLVYPPQGGVVLLVGPRAKDLDPTSVMLTASLRDTVDNQVVSVEQRPVTLAPGPDGWATPDHPDTLFNWSNLPTCPAASATQDLDAQPYLLRIAVQDSTGAQAEAKLTIVPTCEDGTNGDLCRCQCKQSYHLGDPCP